ncbi:EAL domain-containing protein [Camelimonas abortus]|uniref:EAL domain-containing protein n=1 Tax=Camelimonas abortus TaxID=1017184 RepID=A0ABV7LEX1_9HYPH
MIQTESDLPATPAVSVRIGALIAALILLCLPFRAAWAIEAVRVTPERPALDLTRAIERYRSQGDVIQISTAPGPDGIVRRIAVKAREAGSRPDWIVFALTNPGDEQIDRLLVAPHYKLAGSGVIWPDLGSPRIAAITASQGLKPEREDSPDADVFSITLDPGATVTFVAELASDNLPQVLLMDPELYKARENGLTLYKGIILGICGLLALFLTIVFVVKGAVIFPAAAALAWAVLAWACIDFGFIQRLFPFTVGADAVYRAGAETVLAATLLVFLFAYLNLNRWHVRYSHITAAWLVFLGALVGLAVIDPPVASGVARISIAAVAAIGFLLVVNLALHGYDRAVMLIPTWTLLLAWVAAAGLTVTGYINKDLAPAVLIGGLVLVVMLIGFTVLQHAFAGGAIAQGLVSDTERRALALAGSGDVVFDWDVQTDRIAVSPELEQQLGLKRDALSGGAADWLALMHPLDRDHYRATLDSVLEQRRGRINLDFRLRSARGHYVWQRLKARPVVGSDGEVIRIVGSLSDITESKTVEERLLQDSIHDRLTGLPNRQLLLDRLNQTLLLARRDESVRPTVVVIDIDRFRTINEEAGPAAGDAVLQMVARRLARLLKPQDTLARLGGDEFAVMLFSEPELAAIRAFTEQVRAVLAAPAPLGELEAYLTGSIGIALYDPSVRAGAEEMLANAEIAAAWAKRQGGDQVEAFRPVMRSERSEPLALGADLRGALERGEIKLFFRPVVRLEDRTVAGFETILRWDHPRQGRLAWEDFREIASANDMLGDLFLFAVERGARELAAWQDALDVDPPMFATVSLTGVHVLRSDLLTQLRALVERSGVRPGTLQIEVNERHLQEDPEFMLRTLPRLRDAGVGVSLSRFGSSQSPLTSLQHADIDMVKVDSSLVRARNLPARLAILRSLAALAHDLGADVCGDGAEDESDAVELAQLGFDFAQGSAFGEPMSPYDARRLVGSVPEAA